LEYCSPAKTPARSCGHKVREALTDFTFLPILHISTRGLLRSSRGLAGKEQEAFGKQQPFAFTSGSRTNRNLKMAPLPSNINAPSEIRQTRPKIQRRRGARGAAGMDRQAGLKVKRIFAGK
jgi:hypothetical protein